MSMQTMGRAPGAAKALDIAVVGHTNVGKTSLLRTLLRDAAFGEVSHRPSTTRHVEGAALRVGDQPVLVLHDTPGLEDGIGLRDYLDRLSASPAPMAQAAAQDASQAAEGAQAWRRMEGPDAIDAFLASAEARGRYEQEAKVLRQLLAVDAGIVVIDVREPVLPKYRDELAVLAMAGKPLLPVFNFVRADTSHEQNWRDVLARLGLHAAVRFDTVAPAVDGEQRLYGSLALLLERARPALERLQADLAAQAGERRQAAARLMAELLLDVAAARRLVASDDAAVKDAVQSLHQAVREREQRCAQALLALYAFRRGDALARGLPGFDGTWDDDLFNAETLRQFGIRLGGGVAAGAAIGAGVDVMLAGLSLGTATLVGALAGGAFETLRGYGQRILGRLQGERALRVDDAVLRLLALRQLGLVRALEARGHAAQDAIVVDELAGDGRAVQGVDARRGALVFDWSRAPLPLSLEKARAHPEWSSLNNPRKGAWAAPAQGYAEFGHSGREQQVVALAAFLAAGPV